MRGSRNSKRLVRRGTCLTAALGMAFGALAQPAVALTGTSLTQFAQLCMPGFGWYGIIDTSKIQTPGNSGYSATAYGYATAELWSSAGCSPTGSYTVANLTCYTYINTIAYDNGYPTTGVINSTPGGIHQLSTTPYNFNVAAGHIASTNTQNIQRWGNTCQNVSQADDYSDALLP